MSRDEEERRTAGAIGHRPEAGRSRGLARSERVARDLSRPRGRRFCHRRTRLGTLMRYGSCAPQAPALLAPGATPLAFGGLLVALLSLAARPLPRLGGVGLGAVALAAVTVSADEDRCLANPADEGSTARLDGGRSSSTRGWTGARGEGYLPTGCSLAEHLRGDPEGARNTCSGSPPLMPPEMRTRPAGCVIPPPWQFGAAPMRTQQRRGARNPCPLSAASIPPSRTS